MPQLQLWWSISESNRPGNLIANQIRLPRAYPKTLVEMTGIEPATF